jgi:hypothetical protein
MHVSPPSRLNGLLRPFAVKAGSHIGPGVSKSNQTQNNVATKDSAQAAGNFSQLLDTTLDNSPAEASSWEASGQPLARTYLFSKQTDAALQRAFQPPALRIPPGVTDAPDGVVLPAGEKGDTNNVKPQLLADAIELVLQSASQKADAAGKTISADTQKPADTQKKEYAAPALPTQNDVGASVISSLLPLPVTPLIASPAPDDSSIRAVEGASVTSSAPQVSVALEASNPIARAGALAFEAHLSPEPEGVTRASTDSGPAPQTAGTATVGPHPASVQAVPQNASPVPQTSDSVDGAAESARALTEPAGNPAFSDMARTDGKSSEGNHARQSDSPAEGSPARPDNLTTWPAQGADSKAPGRLDSVPSSGSTQATPMQAHDAAASPQTKTDITLRLQGQSGETVSVRVSDRAGDVQIAVRSSDPATATALRHDLPTLQSGLEHAGWRLESGGASMQPPAAMHQPGRNDGGASDQSRQGSQGRAEDYSQSGRRRSSPNDQWMDIMNTNA